MRGISKLTLAFFADLVDRFRILSISRYSLRRSLSPDSKYETGYLFIAFGEKYIREAANAASSLRRFTTKRICLVSDSRASFDVFDDYLFVERVHARSKVDYIFDSPYRKTIYLDSDTFCLEPIDDLFGILEKYDVFAAHDYTRKRLRWSRLWPEYDSIPEAFSEVNGGVLGFKKDTTTSLFEDWRRLYYLKAARIKWDQPSLRVSLWRFEGRIYILPPEFNLRSNATRLKAERQNEIENSPSVMRPRILHWRGASEESRDQAAPL